MIGICSKSLWAWGTYQDYWIRNETTGEWRIIQRAMDYPVSLML